ncbi:MAG: N-formylglutamate amidohydrolase [Novosphingobium sp.]
MIPLSPDPVDSRHAGGWIPGLEGEPAFVLHGSEASPLPVLIAAPHGGRAYPPAVTAAMRDPDFAAMRLEDRWVDRLAEAVAAATGAALLVARAPRAMLDLNRAADDIDWEMVEPEGAARATPRVPHPPGAGRRARNGLGLVPRHLPGLGEIWSRRTSRAELDARIAGIHAPYHRCVGEVMAGLRARWGAALMLDLHSMPPLTARPGGVPAAEFVVGDRFGSACDGGLVAATFAWFAEAGRRAAHNRPYAGGFALERHAAPRRGLHALQIEVDRRCYLEPSLRELGEGLAATAELIAGLVRRLAAEVALLGNEPAIAWPIAAE